MGQPWEVRLGRRIRPDGSWVEAYVAHIFDPAGRPIRSRWFGLRADAERWAQDNQALERALASASASAQSGETGAGPLSGGRLRAILAQGGERCSAAEAAAMAAELLELRAAARVATEIADGDGPRRLWLAT